MPTGSCARKGAAAQACPWSVARAYAPTEHYTRAYLLALTRHVHLCLPCTCTHAPAPTVVRTLTCIPVPEEH